MLLLCSYISHSGMALQVQTHKNLIVRGKQLLWKKDQCVDVIQFVKYLEKKGHCVIQYPLIIYSIYGFILSHIMIEGWAKMKQKKYLMDIFSPLDISRYRYIITISIYIVI